MIGLILAAGGGSRIKEYSRNIPKSFINIFKKKKIIDYQISVLKKIRVKKIIIVVGYKKELFYKKYYKDKKIKIIVNKNWKKTNVLDSFSKAINYLNDDFIFIHADSIVHIKLYKDFLKCKHSTIPFKEKKTYPNEDMKLYYRKKKIFLTKKNLYNSKPKGEFLGIGFFKKDIVAEMKKKINFLKKNKNYASFFIENMINLISKRYTLKIKNIHKLKFVEVDFPEDLIEAKTEFKLYLSKFF